MVARPRWLGALPGRLRAAGAERPAAAPAPAYDADGISTVHFSPFMAADSSFGELYDRVAARWFPDHPLDVRWRAWLLVSLARQCRRLATEGGGEFAEFGVYRAGYAEMILAGAGFEPPRMHLFDTFEGIPAAGLTEAERAQGMAGLWNATSAEYVREALSPWASRIELWAGDVRETLATAEVGPLAFAHLDLNAADPTAPALRFALERLLPGGVVAFDDYGYGWDEYADQRRVIDEVLADFGEEAVALPTGQAFAIRSGGAHG